MLRKIRRRLGRCFSRGWFLVICVITILWIPWTRENNFYSFTSPRISEIEFSKVNHTALQDLAAANYVVNEHEKPATFGNKKITQDSLADSEMDGLTEDALHRNLHDVSLQHGNVNVHIWRGLCCPKINSLRQYPLFPDLANEQFLRPTINSHPLGTWYGQRITGYIHPPRTGSYTFHLNAHVFAELWLSRKVNLKDAELIAKVARPNRKSTFIESVRPTSKELYLNADRKYFFDVLHVMNGGMLHEDHVNVLWKTPGSKQFGEIASYFLSPLLDENASASLSFKKRSELLKESPSVLDTERNNADSAEGDEDYEGIELPKPNDKLSEKFVSQFGSDFDNRFTYSRNNFEGLPQIEHDISFVLPGCPYEPTYVTKRNFKRYEGVWQTHYSSVFPDDGTSEFICIQNKLKEDCKGNELVKEDEILDIVEMFMKLIERKLSRKLSLKAIVNIEKNSDPQRGNRYLLELVLRDDKKNQILQLSDSVYKFHNRTSLCKPDGITWTRNATVNVILTVKNQGVWAQHFINEMSRICEQTRDDHVHIILVDYNSQDIDVEKSLRRSSLKSYTVLKRSGAFHKTEAIESAVNTIKDPQSIVLLFDLHLRTPDNLLTAVRKHTVEGRMAFTPVLFRLTFCARPLTSTNQPKGYWETFGYGIFGIYKSDWDKFGGMNVQEFQNRWGGEDWEMIDRVLSIGLEVERLRMPGFYHFYHSKEGMWDKSLKTT